MHPAHILSAQPPSRIESQWSNDINILSDRRFLRISAVLGRLCGYWFLIPDGVIDQQIIFPGIFRHPARHAKSHAPPTLSHRIFQSHQFEIGKNRNFDIFPILFKNKLYLPPIAQQPPHSVRQKCPLGNTHQSRRWWRNNNDRLCRWTCRRLGGRSR
jgi:hypothetical protein